MAIARLFKGLLEIPEEFISASGKGSRTLFEDKPPKLSRPEIIGGTKAIVNYSSKASDDELDFIESNIKLAQDMFKRGASFDEQVARTGYGFGPDDKLRFEIPDTGAKLSVPMEMLEEGDVYKAKDLLLHPKLYDYYPDLAEKKIKMIKDEENPLSFGAYNPDTNEVELNIASDPFTKKVKDLGNPVPIVSGLLHEVQHFVQQKENFIQGTNKKKFLKKYTNKSWEQASKEDKDKAMRDYLKSYGEAESRNVQLRYAEPINAEVYKYPDTVTGTRFTQTMGTDPDTIAAFKRVLGPTEFTDREGGAVDARLDYVNPFPSTVEDMQ